MRIRPPVAATLLLGLALGVPGACAPAFAGGEEEQDGDARHAHLLTEQQIRDSSLYTALDVVRTLRPAWIRVRPMSISNPGARRWPCTWTGSGWSRASTPSASSFPTTSAGWSS